VTQVVETNWTGIVMLRWSDDGMAN